MKTNMIVENFKKEGCDVFLNPNATEQKKVCFVYVHTLAAGGSQMALESLLPRLKEKGFGIWVISPEDGIYRDILLQGQYAVHVIIQKDYCISDSLRTFLAQTTDLVVVNSICSNLFAYYYINTAVPVIWWFHEAINVMSEYTDFMPHPKLVSSNFHFVGPWTKTNRDFHKAYDADSSLLAIEVADAFVATQTKHDKIRFLLPGSYSPHKGFPNALRAICQLPPHFLERAEFTFCGYIAVQSLYDQILEFASKIPNVNILGFQNREQLDSLYEDSDCIIIPSLFDAGPLTAVEALMHQKLCIVSDTTGAADYITDCVNGFVYPSDNDSELLKRLMLIIQDFAAMKGIAKKGRQLYLENFTKQAIDAQFDELYSTIFPA